MLTQCLAIRHHLSFNGSLADFTVLWVRGSREKPSREKPMLVLQEDTGVHSIDALAAAVEPRRLVRVYRSQYIV